LQLVCSLCAACDQIVCRLLCADCEQICQTHRFERSVCLILRIASSSRLWSALASLPDLDALEILTSNEESVASRHHLRHLLAGMATVLQSVSSKRGLPKLLLLLTKALGQRDLRPGLHIRPSWQEHLDKPSLLKTHMRYENSTLSEFLNQGTLQEEISSKILREEGLRYRKM